jgi:predicted flap endonuclease-1-like 5' DNA nuclease
MSSWACFLWWILFGALLGWLASWLLGRMFRREAAPVERVVEKFVDRPVERTVDNPAHLARIKDLESEVAVIAGLRGQIQQLQSAPAKTVEKIVEKPVEKIVEKIVEKPVDRVVEKVVTDTKGIEERDQKLRDLQKRYDDLNGEFTRFRRGPDIDLGAARAAGFKIQSVDDLEIVEGIGPKINELLKANGIVTFRQLADSTPEQIRQILDKGGPTFRVADPGTWPEQSELAARNRWRALQSLQGVLVAGVRVEGSGPEAEAKDLRAKLAASEAELKRMRQPMKIDMQAAKAAGFNLKRADDLEIIEGIGPKIAELFYAEGINTFAALANMTPEQIQPILDKGGANFKLAKPDTWPEQAELAARNRWLALKSLQQALLAGNR